MYVPVKIKVNLTALISKTNKKSAIYCKLNGFIVGQ